MKWNYINIDNRPEMVMSGWKLYIAGDKLTEAQVLAKLLLDVMISYNLTCKVATKDIIKRNCNKSLAWSVMVIYLTDIIFSQDQFDTLIRDIEERLDYYNTDHSIIGAKKLSSYIYYRYDLDILIDPAIGIGYDNYLKHYRGELGKYYPFNKHTITHQTK